MVVYKLDEIKKKDLADRKPVKVIVGGKPIMLVMIDNEPYAIGAVCSHRGGPLEKGPIEGLSVKCPWHGAIYDLTTGKALPTTPWGKEQGVYRVTIDNNTGDVLVDM
jgi:nitrite reductase/ring-hydroxylating ferredoxin subunit